MGFPRDKTQWWRQAHGQAFQIDALPRLLSDMERNLLFNAIRENRCAQVTQMVTKMPMLLFTKVSEAAMREPLALFSLTGCNSAL